MRPASSDPQAAGGDGVRSADLSHCSHGEDHPQTLQGLTFTNLQL